MQSTPAIVIVKGFICQQNRKHCKKLVKSFSDGNAASIDQGLDYAEMGRYLLKRYIRIALSLVNQLHMIVVFQDDQGPQRPVFSGNPDPESHPNFFTIRRRNGFMDVPMYRYYSSDLGRWVYQLRIPFPRGATAETIHREIYSILPGGGLVQIRGNTVYFKSEVFVAN